MEALTSSEIVILILLVIVGILAKHIHDTPTKEPWQ